MDKKELVKMLDGALKDKSDMSLTAHIMINGVHVYFSSYKITETFNGEVLNLYTADMYCDELLAMFISIENIKTMVC